MADDDLIAQLRNLWEQPDDALDATVRAAADEIERLRAVIAEALAAHYAINTDSDGERCHECWRPWPCATSLELSRAVPDAAEPRPGDVVLGADGIHRITAEPEWTDPEPQNRHGWRHPLGPHCVKDPACITDPRTREQFDAEEGTNR